MIRRTLLIALVTAVVLATLAAAAFAASGTVLTISGPTVPAKYPRTVDVTGTLLTDGLPPATPQTVEVGTTSGGVFTPVASATTAPGGSWRATVRPTANAQWTARWGDVYANPVLIRVAPRVSLALSHLKSGTRLGEVFTGAVAPSHAGRSVLIQKRTAGGVWKKVASGRLNSRSRFRIVWYVPLRNATYTLRATLPPHADHVRGVSVRAYLTVTVGR